MKKFLKENKLLSVIFIIAIIVIMLYILTIDEPELFSHAGDLFSVLYQLAIGFVINFMFYVTQVYVPRLKQMKQANDCVYKRVERIENYMQELFKQLAHRYISEFDGSQELTSDQFYIIMQNLDFEHEVKAVKANRANMSNPFFTVKEWMTSRMEFIEHDIDKLYLYYSAYISAELMNILESILKSSMHQTMKRTFFQLPQKITFKECNEDNFFEPYYKLMKELRVVKQQYK